MHWKTIEELMMVSQPIEPTSHITDPAETGTPRVVLAGISL